MRRRGLGSAGIALVALLLLVPATASAKPRLAGIFDLSGMPGRITLGPDGNVWTTVGGSVDGNLARIGPTGAVTYFEPIALVNPVGLTNGPDGNLWATRNGGVVRIPPGDPEAAQDFNIVAIADPRDITPGPGGKLWTASNDQLVSFAPSDPNAATALTVPDMSARGIASSAGRLWIADAAFTPGGRIVSATPGGTFRFFNVGGAPGSPRQVAAGPPRTIAYTNPGTDPHTVGRIRQGGTARTTNAAATDADGITYAADGNWWTANFLSGDLGILTPKGRFRHAISGLPENSPRYLTAGRGGTIWVSLEQTNEVARIKGVTPQTKIRKGPRGEVPADDERTRVRFKFGSSAATAKFKCKLKGAGTARFKRCKRRKTYRLEPGEYKLIVRASHMGATDPTPAKRKFEIVG
jgi:hypothetical protein